MLYVRKKVYTGLEQNKTLVVKSFRLDDEVSFTQQRRYFLTYKLPDTLFCLKCKRNPDVVEAPEILFMPWWKALLFRLFRFPRFVLYCKNCGKVKESETMPSARIFENAMVWMLLDALRENGSKEEIEETILDLDFQEKIDIVNIYLAMGLKRKLSVGVGGSVEEYCKSIFQD